jgi:hypothetical protein
MPKRRSQEVTVERVIPVPAARLFDVVANPAMHPVIDGSGTVKGLRTGAPARLSLGDRFGMDMRIGRRYRITNQVVEFEEGRLMAWDHLGRARWRYRFEPVGEAGESTRVVESWDWSGSPWWVALGLAVLGFRGRNRRSPTGPGPGWDRRLIRTERRVASPSLSRSPGCQCRPARPLRPTRPARRSRPR